MFYVDSNKFINLLLNFSESDAAIRKKAGLSPNSWYSAKKGDKPLKPSTINRIAAALNVNPQDIVYGEAIYPSRKKAVKPA